MKLYTKNESFSRGDHCLRKETSNEKELDMESVPLSDEFFCLMISEVSATRVLSIPFLLPRYKTDKGQLTKVNFTMLTKR